MKQLPYIAAALLVLYASVACGESVNIPGGSISLLPGWFYQASRGGDSFFGHFLGPNGQDIKHDIGGLAGDISAHVEAVSRVWTKRQSVPGGRLELLLTKDNLILATFTFDDRKYSPANFFTTIKGPEDIADFLLIILSYRHTGAMPATTEADAENGTGLSGTKRDGSN